jgi:DNA-binding response OmpR family regulator
MTKRILICEDEKPFIKALRHKLEGEGFEVLEATDGQMATEILKKEKVDLILLDLMLPYKNGFEVLEEMEKHHPKVIVMSNLGQKEDQERVNKLGVADYLVKAEVSLADVVMYVEKLLT